MSRVHRSLVRSVRNVIDGLERRQLLAGELGSLPTDILNQLNAIDGSMQNISAAVHKLPVIGKSADQIDEIRHVFNTFSHPLRDALTTINQALNPNGGLVQSTIGPALRNLGILGDTDGNGTVNNQDIIANSPLDADFSVRFNLKKVIDLPPIPAHLLSLGLGSLPIGIRAGGDATFQVTFEYKNFKFGRNAGGFYFDSSFDREVSFKLGARLPNQLSILLGIFNATATNNTVGDNLDATISANINGFSVESPRLGGNANFNLGIETGGAGQFASFLPKIKTDLVLSWPFGSPGAGGESAVTDLLGSYSQFGLPTVAFNNLSVGLGSLLGDVIQPIATTLSSVTRPLQDAIDSLYRPIPGISDVSTTFGGPNITIAELAAFNGFFPEGNRPLNENFQNFVQLTSKLRTFVTTVNQLASSPNVDNLYVPLGNFPVSGPTGGSLLVKAGGEVLGNLLGGALDLDWSELLAQGASLSYTDVLDRILDVAGEALGSNVADILTQLRDSAGLGPQDGVTFAYPIVEQTKDQLLNALLGKEATFVTMTARWQQQQFGDTFFIPLAGPLGVSLQIEARPDAFLRAGLDSFGLKRAIQAVVDGSQPDPLTAMAIYLPDSVYVMSDSHFKVDGALGAGFGVGTTGASATINAGFTANLDVYLDVANPNTARKIRPFAQNTELGANLFRVSGAIRGRAGFTVEVGIDPFEVSKTWDFAEKTLFTFDTYPSAQEGAGGVIPNPFRSNLPPTLGTFEEPGILTLSMGTESRRLQRGIAVTDINEKFTVTEYRNSDSQRVIVVNAYGREQEFLGVNMLNIQGEDGNDNISVEKGVTVPVVIGGGSGNDIIVTYTTGQLSISGGNDDDQISALTGTGNADIYGSDGNDAIYVRSGSTASTPRYVNLDGGAGDDVLQVASLYNSAVNLSMNGGSGSDSISVTAISKPFLSTWMSPNPISVSGGPTAEPGDELIWRNAAALIPGPNGYSQLLAHHTFLITDATVRRQTADAPVDVNYTNLSRISLSSNGGNDTVQVTASNKTISITLGGGDDRFIAGGVSNVFHVFGEAGDDDLNVWGGYAFSTANQSQMWGNDGFDAIEFDVSLANFASFTRQPGQTSLSVNGGVSAILNTSGWEGVRFTGTAGDDFVLISDSVIARTHIDLRGGDDSVILDRTTNAAEPLVNNNITLDFGTGANDELLWLPPNSMNSLTVNSNTLTGQGDLSVNPLNFLSVGTMTGVDRIQVNSGNQADTLTINAGSDPQRRYDIHTGDGTDAIVFRNRGNATAGSTINGGAGLDTLVFDDSESVVGLPYQLLPLAIATQPFFGAPSQTHARSGVESLTLRTGSGSDQVRVSGGAVGLSPLSIITGAGDDWVYGDSTPLDDFSLFTTFLALGEGNDRLSVRNTASAGAASWTFLPGKIEVFTGFLTAEVYHDSAERFDFDGGAGADTMNVPAIPSSQAITLRGGAGDDTYNTYDTATRRTDSIQSFITIDDSSGNDTLRADNAGKPDTGGLGDWVHLTQGVLSHTTNDRFFAPGGRVVHSGINHLNIQTSQADDYVVVTPSPDYVIHVYDSNIVNSSQDNIYFSLAGVQSPEYLDLITIWRLQSTNRLNVDVSGFENPTLGSEVPAITQPPSPVFDAPAFYVNVTFDVPMDIYTFGSGEAFLVQNLTTGQTLPAGSMLASDSGANGFFITFPGYEGGLPPDGRYRITLNGDYVRSINYNPLGADHAYDFSILRGDADNDGIVAFSDLLILAQNYGQLDRSWSTGDFNFDGVVDFNDLLLLAQRYGVTFISLTPTPSATRRSATKRPLADV